MYYWYHLLPHYVSCYIRRKLYYTLFKHATEPGYYIKSAQFLLNLLDWLSGFW